MKYLSGRVYFGSHLYTCTGIHTKPELCLLSDVVLWAGVLFFTEDWQTTTKSPELWNYLHMDFRKMSLNTLLCLQDAFQKNVIYENDIKQD